MSKVKTRAVGILINDGKILLIHRTREGKEYWVFPGGGKENDETVEEAVVREIEEESSIKCEIEKLLYIHKYSDINHTQYFCLCKYISGIPKLGNFNELQTMKDEDQTYEPVWEKISKLPKMLVYPLEIRDWVIKDAQNDFKNIPKSATLKTTELRQDI